MQRVPVLVPTPAHSGLDGALTYRSDTALTSGTLVRVPLGRREVLGMVWTDDDQADTDTANLEALKPVVAVFEGVPPLSAPWRALIAFTARYYQRSLGEVALSVLPAALRESSREQFDRRLAKRRPAGSPPASLVVATDSVALTQEQQSVLTAFDAEPGPFLLFGATGSGKTEVYLQAARTLLQRDPAAQVLLLVPEINLTPQLEARLRDRFGAAAVVSLHSGMTPPQRLNSWLAAHLGAARIVLGTRLAVFASMPRLRLVVVDEEHDPSYKSRTARVIRRAILRCCAASLTAPKCCSVRPPRRWRAGATASRPPSAPSQRRAIGDS